MPTYSFHAEVEAAIRVMHPHLRRIAPVGITRNGSRKRVFTCLCGRSISMDPRWPETARVSEFRARHDRECGRALLQSIGVRVDRELDEVL